MKQKIQKVTHLCKVTWFMKKIILQYCGKTMAFSINGAETIRYTYLEKKESYPVAIGLILQGEKMLKNKKLFTHPGKTNKFKKT